MIDSIGLRVITGFCTVSDIFKVLVQSVANVRLFLGHEASAVRAVLFKQIYFTGLEALKIIVTISTLIGAIIVAQVVSLVGSNGALTGKILVWGVLRELAPLLTAIIITARSGTAIAAELGAMKINGEIEAIEMLGIPVDRYLVMPRVIGVTASVVILSVYFVLTSFIGSFAIASIGWHIPYEQFSQGVLSSLGVREMMVLCIKSACFGMVISSTCCAFGLNVGQSVTEVPQAATKAVMVSLFSVVAIDGLITFLASALTMW